MTRHCPRGAHRRPAGRMQSIVAALCAVLLIALAVISGSSSLSGGPSPAAVRPVSLPVERTAAPAHPVPAPVLAAAAVPVSAPPRAASVPATVRVTLHYGDTLWALSRSHGTSVSALQALNGLGHSTLIYAGRTLLVPATPDPAVPAPPSHAAVRAAARTQNAAPAAPAPAASGRAAVAVAFAERQLGVPYVWGGTGNGGYDCSGLVQAAWHAAGVSLPRTTYAQIDAGTRISRDQLQPGDLVFSNGVGHVQLYIGHGTVIEAPHTGATVQYSPLPPPGQVDAYVRVG